MVRMERCFAINGLLAHHDIMVRGVTLFVGCTLHLGYIIYICGAWYALDVVWDVFEMCCTFCNVLGVSCIVNCAYTVLLL